MPTPVAQSSAPSPAMEIVPGWALPVVTPRGRAAARLSEFQDCWNELDQADRQWFAEWLNGLLIDAVLATPAEDAETCVECGRRYDGASEYVRAEDGTPAPVCSPTCRNRFGTRLGGADHA